MEAHGSSAAMRSELELIEQGFDRVEEDVNLKADHASPKLSGKPTAPTATVGTKTDQIATTAFVANEIKDKVVLLDDKLTDEASAREAADTELDGKMRVSQIMNFAVLHG
jgi:hypothetical protein